MGKGAPQGPAYMQLFAILMLLLLSFFVILNTLTQEQESGFHRDIGKVRTGFGFIGENLGVGIFTPQGQKTLEEIETKSGQIGDKQFPKKTKPDPLTGEDSQSTPDAEETPPLEYYRVQIPDNFPEGEHELTPDIMEYLDVMGTGLAGLEIPFSIRSYSRETGNEAEDQSLALRRAASIARYLHKNARIPLARITSAGYADQRYFEFAEGSDEQPEQATFVYIKHVKNPKQ